MQIKLALPTKLALPPDYLPPTLGDESHPIGECVEPANQGYDIAAQQANFAMQTILALPTKCNMVGNADKI
jgi:hypothetical protein